MFRTVPLSIIRSFSLYTQQWYTSYKFSDSLQAGSGYSILILLASCQQTCMTYTIAVCTVKNSWWWTEDLSETSRVSFQNKFEKLVHLIGFIIRNLSRCTLTWKSKMYKTSHLSTFHESRATSIQIIKAKLLRWCAQSVSNAVVAFGVGSLCCMRW